MCLSGLCDTDGLYRIFISHSCKKSAQEEAGTGSSCQTAPDLAAGSGDVRWDLKIDY